MPESGFTLIDSWAGTRAASAGVVPAAGEPINIIDEPGHVRIGDGSAAAGHRVGLLPDNALSRNTSFVNSVFGVWTHVPDCDVTLPRAGSYLVTLAVKAQCRLEGAPRTTFTMRTRLRNNTLNAPYTTPEGPRFVRTTNDGQPSDTGRQFYELSNILIAVTGPDSIGMEITSDGPGQTPFVQTVIPDLSSMTYVGYVEVRT